MYLPYAGIGSRETPKHVLHLMTKCASRLESLGFILRSGGADGADKAFENGVSLDSNKEVFLPWKGFNNSNSPLYNIPEEAFSIAEMAYSLGKDRGSSLSTLKQSVQKLMARNTQQILGNNLDSPSLFVLCYTSDGVESYIDRSYKTGGTGQAIALASYKNIPVFNMKNDKCLERLGSFLKVNKYI